MVEPLNTKTWVMVPVEPTAEMVDAGGRQQASGRGGPDSIYRAMLSASPALPVVDGGEEETSSSRNDDLVASSALYQCDECIAEEREFSCHQIEDVVIVNGKVVCKDCVAEFYAKARTERAPDIAKKLRRQRMSVAQQQKRASAAESRVLSLEEEVKRLRRLGDALSNITFNLAQLSSPLTNDQKAVMREAVTQWDAGRAALKENGQ